MNQKRPLTFSLFFLRLLSGIAGGVVGILMAFVVFFIMNASVVPSDDSNSLTTFTIIFMAFAATLSSNMTVAAMAGFMDSEKYHRRKTTLIHVLIFNVLLFLLSIPLYILAISADIVPTVAALQFLLSAFVTALIMEILAGYQYILLGLYTTSLAIFISIGISMLLGTDKLSPQFLFAIIPMVWLVIQLINAFGELIYDNFLKLYGLDALSTSTDLGGDESEEENEGDENKDEEDESDEQEKDPKQKRQSDGSELSDTQNQQK